MRFAEFTTAFPRLAGAEFSTLTGVSITAFVTQLPHIFFVADPSPSGNPLFKNVRWPLPLNPPASTVPVVVPMAPPVSAAPTPVTTPTATPPTAPMPTVTPAASVAVASNGSTKQTENLPKHTLTGGRNDLAHLYSNKLSEAEGERVTLSVLMQLMGSFVKKPVAIATLLGEFHNRTGKRITELLPKPARWLAKQPGFVIEESGPGTHLVALQGTPAIDLMPSAKKTASNQPAATPAPAVAAAPAPVAATSTSTSSSTSSASTASTAASTKTVSVKTGEYSRPNDFPGPMSFDEALDRVCDALADKELTFTRISAIFMSKTGMSFSKAVGVMPGVFLRSGAVSATGRIQVWKKDTDWYAARRGNSVGADTSLAAVRKKAIPVLVRLLNKDGGRSKLHHIANVFERETTQPLATVFGAPLTRTLLEEGRNEYFMLSGERVLLAAKYNLLHQHFDEDAHAALEKQLSLPASVVAPAAAAPAAAAAPVARQTSRIAGAAASTSNSADNVAQRTLFASPLPPTGAQLNEAQRSEKISALLRAACERAFGKVESVATRVATNVAVVTFGDEAAYAHAQLIGSVVVEGTTVSLTSVSKSVAAAAPDNESVKLARQALDAAMRAGGAGSTRSAATLAEAIFSVQSGSTAAATASAAAATPADAPPGLGEAMARAMATPLLPRATPSSAPVVLDLNARLAQLAAAAPPPTAAAAAAPAVVAPVARPAPVAAPVDVNAINARLMAVIGTAPAGGSAAASASAAASSAASAASPHRGFVHASGRALTPVEAQAVRKMQALIPAAEKQCKLHLRECEWDVVKATVGLLAEMDEETRTCCICQLNEIELQLVECRHACVCRTCFRQLVQTAKKKNTAPVECPLCREEIHNSIAIKMPNKATLNERKDVERIIMSCADKPERLRPAQLLAKGGYSLQMSLIALLRSGGKADRAEQWLKDNCFTFVSADEAVVAASVAARAAAASKHVPKGLEPTPAELMALKDRYNIHEYDSWEEFNRVAGATMSKHLVPSTAASAAAVAAAANIVPAATFLPTVAPAVVAAPVAPSVPPSVVLTNMTAILQAEGMSYLIGLFQDNEIDHDVFVMMSDHNLYELGVTDATTRSRLLEVIRLKKEAAAAQ